MYKPVEVKSMKESVLRELARGKSLDAIVAEGTLKDDNIVYKWLHTDAQFKEDYGRARLKQVEYYGEKIETVIKELKEDAEPSREKTDIARLEVDSLKWIASRMQPKIYGANTGQTNIQVNVSPVTGMQIVDEVSESPD